MTLDEIEDRTPAENITHTYYAFASLFVGNIQYEMVQTSCACTDRKFYHGHLAGKRNHFFVECAAHGLQDCGIAVRAQRAPADDTRTERRRKSGYTTEVWYRQRGK